jgi:cobalt-zinc-cadmium efflux system membrane fusion protein
MMPFLAFLILLFLSSGCTGTPESKTLPQELEKRAIQTHRVTYQEVASFIEATGTIQPDAEGSAKITCPLAGTVENILVKVGDRVKKGDPLASIRSPDVSDTFSNYLSNLSQLRQAERIYQLNKQLFDVGAVTKNDLLASEANCEQIKALSEALKRKLEIYGVNVESGFTEKQVIKSPMEGSVVDIPAHVGDRVDPSIPFMVVADSQKVLVVANIYDTDVSHIQKGKEVTFTTDIFPGARFKGVITYISDSSDLETKTIKTYIRILSDYTLFKQNMFLKIKIDNSRRRLALVPKTALLYKDGKFNVYLKTGGNFELRQVRPANEVSDKLIAVEGLKEGEMVVLSAIEMEQT